MLYNKNSSVCLQRVGHGTHHLEVSEMALDRLPGRGKGVVADTKFLASSPHDRSDEGVVGLEDTREEVVGHLVIE